MCVCVLQEEEVVVGIVIVSVPNAIHPLNGDTQAVRVLQFSRK